MHEPKQTQLIVGFVSDLMFSTKIANVAQHLGFQMEWVETAVSAALGAGISVSPAAQNLSRTQPGEALHGREGVLFEKITAWQPALLLFDLTNDQIPWRRWIAILKSSPATRRLPILCFAPHKNGADIEAARAAGADKVVARSKFVRDMPDLLESYARVVDTAVLAQSCQSPLPDLALIGIRLFNQGEYYKCHDALEEAWRQETSPIRELYRSILQVGIAYFQIERGNYRGGMKMLLRVRQWLDPLPAHCRGVNIDQLRQDVDAVQRLLTQLGPDRIAEFDKTLFRPIDYEEGNKY